MPRYTEHLNLFERDPATEGDQSFNVTTMLNENWDKIDAFAGQILGREVVMTIGSYVGDGQSGASHPREITGLNFVPDVVIVRRKGFVTGQGSLTMIRPMSDVDGSSTGVTWSTDGVSWYTNRSSGYANAEVMCNVEGVTYYYAILGHREVSG